MWTLTGARLANHRIGIAPLEGIDTAEICSEQCKETLGCRAFNYDQGHRATAVSVFLDDVTVVVEGVKSCELASQVAHM